MFWEQYAAAAHGYYGSVGSMSTAQAKKYKQKMNTLQKKLDKKSSAANQKSPPKASKEKKTTAINPYTSK
jgi:hypothetical protein